jgi:SAM-dependent methyltransferase
MPKSIKAYSNPAAYWESRLKEQFDLTGVGHIILGPAYNHRLYVTRLRTLEQALHTSGCSLRGRRVLEIGCGTGFYTEFCREQQVADYLGVDITAVSVQNLTQRFPDFHFHQADVGDPTFFVKNTYDVVLVADVLFHIVDDDRFHQAIANMSASLNSGGYLILSDLLAVQTIQPAQHFRARSLAMYTDAFSRCNLTVQHIEPIFAVMHPPAAAPSSSWPWRLYGALWRYGLSRLAHRRWFDHSTSALFDYLDRRLFLPRAGVNTPNSKWLVAVKHNAV